MDTDTHHSEAVDPPETDEEARLNRGFITVFEQTKDTENYTEGERYLSLGFNSERRFILDEEKRGFTAVAVPIATIELPQLLEQDELNDWVNSDVGKLVLQRYTEDLEPPDVLTEWGKERVS